MIEKIIAKAKWDILLWRLQKLIEEIGNAENVE